MPPISWPAEGLDASGFGFGLGFSRSIGQPYTGRLSYGPVGHKHESDETGFGV
jgi:hypothetical protein